MRAEILALKREVSGLKRQMKALRGDFGDDESEEFTSTARLTQSSGKRGRKTKHSPNLTFDRDMLVRLLEQNWPEIEPYCSPKANMAGLMRVLTKVQGDPQSQLGEAAQKLLDNRSLVEQFLTSPKFQKRFQGDPRVFASALAGAPKIGLWRSMKLCPPKSCRVDMGVRAMRSYLRRKHSDLYRTLDAGIDLVQLVAWLRTYRTRDHIVANLNAKGLLRFWEAGRTHSLSATQTGE